MECKNTSVIYNGVRRQRHSVSRALGTELGSVRDLLVIAGSK